MAEYWSKPETVNILWCIAFVMSLWCVVAILWKREKPKWFWLIISIAATVSMWALTYYAGIKYSLMKFTSIENGFEQSFWWINIALFASAVYVMMIFVKFSEKKRLVLLSLLLLSLFSWRMSHALVTNVFMWPDLFENFVESIKNFAFDTSYRHFFYCTQYVMTNMNIPEWFVCFYVPFLYFAAPVTGAIAILEIVSNLFGKIDLFFKFAEPWKEMYYFSELNDQSYALASSICKRAGKKPIVVFTDTYLNEDDEKSSELYFAAKEIGAICLKDDILHINMRKNGRKNIILIDDDEDKNVHCVLSLLDEAQNDKHKKDALKDAFIAVCADSRAYSLVSEKIKKTADEMFEDKRTIIRFVNVYSNMVRNMMKKMPLYEPLVGSKGKDELNLTIIGAGAIGTELFLSAYWYGQILGYKFNINVVSKEPEINFINKINFINPEIFGTVEYVMGVKSCDGRVDDVFSECGSNENVRRTKDYKRIMKLYPERDECGQPYLTFRYFQTDIKDDDLAHKLSQTHWKDGFKLYDTDYFAVALGEDAVNVQIAEKLNKYVNDYKLTQKNGKKTVIACAVYNAALAGMIGKNQKEYVENLQTFIYAFGSFKDVFSLENMLMLKEYDKSGQMEKVYQKRKEGFERHEFKIEGKNSSAGNGKSEYEFWANISRALHLRYKAFSAGCITESVFTKGSVEERDKAIETAFSDYVETVKENKNDINSKLLWLEHRRWCAFTRVRGFTQPDDFKKYFWYTGSHKEMELKLHACLVETDINNKVKDIFSAEKTELDSLDYMNRILSDYLLELAEARKKELEKCKEDFADLKKNGVSENSEKFIELSDRLEKLNDEISDFVKRSTTYYKVYDGPDDDLESFLDK